jgi:protein-tyrosine-phosphatase
MNLLFVCSANISRSFLAEHLMKHELKKRQIKSIKVKSAGVYASPGYPPDPNMVEYLEDLDIILEAHESRRIEKEDILWADHILAMEDAHVREIIKAWPESIGKVDLFGRFVSGSQPADDIIDPYGRTPYHYRLAKAQISMGVKNFIETQL